MDPTWVPLREYYSIGNHPCSPDCKYSTTLLLQGSVSNSSVTRRMDQNGAVSFRHRRSPSSDRFLGVFSPPSKDSAFTSSSTVAGGGGDELNEDDVFWTGDFSEPQRGLSSAPTYHTRQSFRQPEKFGILAALTEDHRKPDSQAILLKPSLPSSPSSSTTSLSRAIPSIPKPPIECKYSQSMPSRRFQQSAPVNVPMMPMKPKNGELSDAVDDDVDDDEILPPHEIVARGSSKSPKTTFSVLEGVGRTLKGRDLRQVRNAVWRQTGFLD